MKSLTIKGSKRESVGKKATKALRNAEQVPCVLYGGKENMHFSAPEVAFNKLIYTADVHTVILDLDGTKVNAVLQDIQFHPVNDAILHMDFYQFDDEQPITMRLPVHSEGVPAGVKNGGVLRFNLRRMNIRGLVDKMPDYILAEVSDLKIGDKLYTSSVAGDDYEILHDEDAVICQVIAPRDLEALEAELETEDEVEAGEVPASEVEGEEGEAAEGESKKGESKEGKEEK